MLAFYKPSMSHLSLLLLNANKKVVHIRQKKKRKGVFL